MAHQCSVCLKMFKCASKLQRHLLIHSGEKPFICPVCGKGFRQAIHLKRHLETHTGNTHALNPFTSSWGQVESVGRVESSASAYPTVQDDVRINYTPDVPLQSCISSEVDEPTQPVQPGDYIVGLKVVEQPEFKPISPDGVRNTDWECQDLTKETLQERQVSSSRVEDANSNADNVLQCAVCLKFCNSPYQLQKHLLVHSRLNPFECSICKQTFTQIAQLKLHSQTHAQADLTPDVIEVCSSSAAEKVPQCSTSKGKTKISHQCPECPKSFCSPSKLRRHCLTHTGQRPYHCIECGKSFRQLAHLKTHQDTHRTVLNIQAPLYEETTSASKFDNADKYQLSDSELPPFNSSLSLGLQNHNPSDSHQLFNTGISSSTTFTQQPEVSVLVSQNINEWNSEEGPVPEKKAYDEGNMKHLKHNLTPENLKSFQCLVCGQTFCQEANFQKHLCENTDQDKFANHGEVLESNSSPSAQPHLEMTEHCDPDDKMTLQTDEVNALDLNIVVKQEQWLSSNNEEHASSPDGIASTAEGEQQPTLYNTKAEHWELARKTHQCGTCLKCFPTPYKLQRHMLIHTGQRPFSCRVCGKKFRQLAHLMLHNRSHLHVEQIRLKRTNMNIHPSRIQIGHDHVSSGSALKFDVTMQDNVSENLGSKELLMSSALNMPPKRVLDQDSVIRDKSLDRKRKNGPIKHQCPLCFKFFSCPSKLQRHHLIHTGQKPFQCTLCGKTFRQAIHLKVHLQTHNKWRPFRRASRQKGVVNTDANVSRQQHRSSKSGHQEQLATEPQGDLPAFVFQEMAEEKDSGPKTAERGKGDLTVHFESSKTVKSEDWHSNDNGGLQDAHEGVILTKPCELQLTSNDSANKCEKVKRKTYQCATCLKYFLTPYKLERHILMHKRQRRFSCYVCGKKFRQPAHMKFHICTNNQSRFFQMRKHNENNDLFSMKQVEFDRVSSETALESDLTPQKCLQSFEQEKSLEICLVPSTSSESSEFDENLASQGNSVHGKYQCLICHKYFSCPSKLKRHLLIHTGQRPFRCVLCGKTFRQAVHLKVHQQTHNKWRPLKRTSKQDVLVNPDIFCGSGKQLNRPSINQGQWVFSSTPKSDMMLSGCTSEEKMEEEDSTLDYKIRNPEPSGGSTFAVKSDQDPVTELDDWCHSNGDVQSISDDEKKSKECQLQLELLNKVNKWQTQKNETNQCVTCLKSFSTPSKLQRHILTHTGQRPFSCYVCGKKFRQLLHMKFHIYTHNRPRITLQKKSAGYSDPFTLQHVGCDKRSSGAAAESDLSLQNTLQILEQEKCLDTNLIQSSPSERKMDQNNQRSLGRNKHYRKHQCLTCYKYFSCPSKLQRHLLIHTGQKPFHCVQCGKTFRQAIHLKVHQQTHNKWRSLKRASRQDESDGTNASNGGGQRLRWPSSFQGRCTLSCPPQSDGTVSDTSHQERGEDPDVVFKMNSPEPGPVNTPAMQLDQDTVEVLGQLYSSNDDSASQNNNITERPLLVFKENSNVCQELKRNSYQCVVCQKCFYSPSKLQRHILTHTGQRPFSCYVCGKKFRQLSHMKFHICTHIRPRTTMQKKSSGHSDPFTLQHVGCDKVSSVEVAESDLSLQNTLQILEQEKHLDTHPIQISPAESKMDQNNQRSLGRNKHYRKHQCLTCYKCFSCPSKLQRHLLIHTGQKPFHCVQCGKTFRQAVHLKVHQQTHNKWRSLKKASWQDELDGTNASNGGGQLLKWSSSFQGRCSLTSPPQSDGIVSDTSHQEIGQDPDVVHKINSPEPGLVNTLAMQFNQDTVEVPGYMYSRNDDLATQNNSIAKQPLLVSKENLNACQELKRNCYQCVVCQKCFSSPSKLQRHILTHTGQRPFSCYICGKKFRQLSHMKFHIYTHNRPKITQQMRIFESSDTLSLRKNLPDTVPSVTTLDSDCSLQQNTSEKGTDVPLKLNLVSSEAVLDHNTIFTYGRNHSNVKHQCLICFKCFTSPSKLQRHNLIHTGQKPYQCVLCGKTFRQAIHLKVHQQTHNKWRALRKTIHKKEVLTSRSGEQDQTECIITSVPQTNALKGGLNQLSDKEVVDDICAGVVVLEENEKQIDADINTGVTQDTEYYSAPSQQTSSNLIHLLQTPFQCNICSRNFRRFSHLKTHYLIHLETHPVENSFSMKNDISQKPMNYGSQEEDKKVNFPGSRSVCMSSTDTQNSTLETGVVSDSNKNNRQDQASQESSDTEGKNTQREKQDSDCSILSLNGSFQSSRLQHYVSTLPTTQEVEENWDRLSPVDPEDSDCVIIESNEGAREDSPVTQWRANENTEISRLIKKGYQCPVCSKCFSSSIQLQRHVHTHTENTPSKCLFCLKEFMQKSLLNSHQCTHKDRRDVGQFNLNDKGQLEEQDERELSDCDQSTYFTTTEPAMSSWHPLTPDYSTNNINSLNKDMSSPTGLISVRKVKHARKAHQCTVCLKNFESPYKLSRHFLIHTGMKPFKCSVCYKSFRQLCHLQTHKQTHQEKITVEVQQMDSGHSFDHTQDDPSENLVSEGHSYTTPVPQETKLGDSLHLADCTSYPLKPSTNRSLTNNDTSDHSVESIASGSVGILHIIPDAELELKIKQSKRDHKCSECQKSFSSPSKLERHYLIHAGERPFKCTICEKAFRQAAHLKVHQRVHNKMSDDYSSFSSEIIDNGDYRRDSSYSHVMKDITEVPLNYDMSKDISDGQESQVAGVEVALESEHCDEYWCEPLDGLFNCKDCNKSFVTKRRLQLHRCSPTSEPPDTQSSFYQCAICFKNFTSPYKLKRHYVIHTGERPFTCTVCKKTFTQSGHLKTHQLSHK